MAGRFRSAPCDVARDPDVMSQSAFISACVGGEQWQVDVAVLHAMFQKCPV